jgi:hypothetical protein
MTDGPGWEMITRPGVCLESEVLRTYARLVAADSALTRQTRLQ